MREIFSSIGCIYFLILSTSVSSYEENCDYLDKSRKDRTNHLERCYYGCCGDFKTRHCCSGPIAIVGGVFGGILVLLILAVIVGVCYGQCHGKKHVKPIPTISTGASHEIPKPTPPLPALPVYNSARLHPPPIITKSNFLAKTPVPPNATDLMTLNSTSSGRSAVKDQRYSATQPPTNRIQPVPLAPKTKFQDIPDRVKERVFREHHPPPSELHLPRLTPRK